MAKRKAVTGNTSAAIGASLCGLDLIAAYPITPQSSVVEYLAGLVNNGEIDARMVQVESEHSAMSVVQGAAAAGGRVFTATSAQGLALMFEPYMRMSTLRLPMVMAIASREMTSPETVWSGHQDAISVREAGWVQMFCENNQEILDMIIQGYKIAENSDVLLPVNVCYDGFFLSHLVEGVSVPEQDEVNKFLPPVSFDHATLDPDNPFALDPLTPGPLLMKYRKSHLDAMENALEVIDKVDEEFGEVFGRKYGGLIEEYKMDDAEIAIVTMGAMTGTGKDAVDEARAKGIKVGLVKIRFFRPFPAKRIAEALSKVKGFAVIDRAVSFGWSVGAMYAETKSAIAHSGKNYASFSAVGGLGGADISIARIHSVIDKLDAVKDQPGEKETVWLMD